MIDRTATVVNTGAVGTPGAFVTPDTTTAKRKSPTIVTLEAIGQMLTVCTTSNLSRIHAPATPVTGVTLNTIVTGNAPDTFGTILTIDATIAISAISATYISIFIHYSTLIASQWSLLLRPSHRVQ